MDLDLLSVEEKMALVLILKRYRQRQRKKRNFWVHEMFIGRNKFGFFEITYPKIKACPDKFFKYTRMNLELFENLLKLLQNRLQKYSIRKPISAECRLLLTIMYLAHGGPRLIYSSKFLIGETTCRKIIYETCTAIWEELSGVYLTFPNEHEFTEIASSYYRKTKLPNCLGAIDGKHVNIVSPANSGSQYYNYKKKFSIVLLATCDSNNTFTSVDIGAFGSQSDGGIFRNSKFGKMLLDERLPIPKENMLPGTNEKFPYFFVGDSAFPLKKHLLRPYPGKELSPQQTYFNSKLSSARISIENSFGILVKRWAILQSDIHATPEHVDKIIQAVVVLHNYIMLHKNQQYCPPDFVDRVEDDQIVPGQWRSDVTPLSSANIMPHANRSSNESFNLRDKLCEYMFENK